MFNTLNKRQQLIRILQLCIILLVFTTLIGCGIFKRDAQQPPANDEAVEPTVVFDPGSFEDPTVCKTCHGDIYKAWEGSMHAYAWTSNFYQHDYQQGNSETNGGTEFFCGACHAPIAARTGLLPPADASKFDEVSHKGVSCDFCHTISDVLATHNMNSVSEPGNTKLGPNGDGQSGYHQIQGSQLYRSAEFCGACHNVDHPTTNVGVITTFDEWQASSYAADGIVCQDCHMTPTPGVAKNPGKAAIMGPNREHVATHYFEGGSTYSFMQQGSDQHAQMASERLKAAATVDLDATRNDKGIELTVNVTNVGAGHNIPTGVSYIRKMWLEVTLSDNKGQIVYRSGHPDDNNFIDPDAVFYRKVFKDASGNLTSKSWLAEGIGYNRTIPPKGTDSEVYQIPVEGNNFNAQVRLMYRSFSQDNMVRVMGEDAPHIDSIEMAKANITIQ
ncbi:hypothetical protein BHU72_08415 [Desulfuribacillus stibiiarsenatis]|uniref:Cytochrome c-552/4 domain-containing protein n=1 Tax=Desulfuribacillus stibiiarsenatis TaxID=1390249 RepID=A0A1E5L365_9FIRM|nr:multiheme c-type cytochrome [Desulfuribacillus stibiiarsenatis]OEH84524.1 hypothetical protein BHU72_08415 [Desulfuribacillus stibiiarsenatis]